MNLTFNKEANLPLLDEELRAVLNAEVFAGVSQSENQVTVHLLQEIDEETLERIDQIVASHDKATKTAQQLAAEYLQQLRAQFTANPLNPAEFGAEDDLLRRLAERIAWLEKEIVA